MREHTVKTWQEFLELANAISAEDEPLRRSTFFRGQGRDWPLLPSLARITGGTADRSDVIRLEFDLAHSFFQTAHTFMPERFAKVPVTNNAHWWAIMQHYGAPSRLLDWTNSPYVAAYFAVREQHNWESDGHVWYFDNTVARRAAKAKYGDDVVDLIKFANDKAGEVDYYVNCLRLKGIDTLGLLHPPDRAFSQFSRLSITGDPTEDHWKQILSVCSDLKGTEADTFGRIVISSNAKPEFLRQLYVSNVHPIALFPGLDGVGRYLADAAKLRAVGWKSSGAIL